MSTEGDGHIWKALKEKASEVCSPETMAGLEKAFGNPKFKEACEDCFKNGMGAAEKYKGDPEIVQVLDDLKALFKEE